MGGGRPGQCQPDHRLLTALRIRLTGLRFKEFRQRDRWRHHGNPGPGGLHQTARHNLTPRRSLPDDKGPRGSTSLAILSARIRVPGETLHCLGSHGSDAWIRSTNPMRAAISAAATAKPWRIPCHPVGAVRSAVCDACDEFIPRRFAKPHPPSSCHDGIFRLFNYGANTWVSFRKNSSDGSGGHKIVAMVFIQRSMPPGFWLIPLGLG